MTPEEECRSDVFVMIRWGMPRGRQGLGVPLSQLEAVYGNENVRQAVGDWHYWVDRGYEF